LSYQDVNLRFIDKIAFVWTDTPVMNVITLAVISDLLFFKLNSFPFETAVLCFYGFTFPLIKISKFIVLIKHKRVGKFYNHLTANEK